MCTVCDRSQKKVRSLKEVIYKLTNFLAPFIYSRILGGPSKILDPMFHTPTQQDPTEEEQHVDEGSHLPIMLDTDEGEQL